MAETWNQRMTTSIAMNIHRPGGSRLLKWLAVVGFWTVVAVLIATLSHSRLLMVNRPTIYAQWLSESLLIWYGWAAWTPLIIWLGRRFYIDSQRRFRYSAMLLVFGIILITIQTFYQCFVSMTVMDEPMGGYFNQVVAQLAWMGPWNLLIYFGIIGVGYARDYRVRWQEREVAVRELETQLTRAQLDVLKSQLQPHFFFNTLNSISVLIRKGEPDHAQAMLGQLSDLLRYTLSIGSRQTVPLSDELAFVQGYLEIEQTRFGERLTTAISAAPDCLSVEIPPLMIQPIVENAIRHGLADKVDGGRVGVSITRTASSLTCAVEDNGVGYRRSPVALPREGLGLGNTRARMERLFGDKYSLTITAIEDGGTRVIIVIPIGQSTETNS
jgi:hypothetical protein